MLNFLKRIFEIKKEPMGLIHEVIVDNGTLIIRKSIIPISKVLGLSIRHSRPGAIDNVLRVDLTIEKPESQRTPYGLGSYRLYIGSTNASDKKVNDMENVFRGIGIRVSHI